VVVNGPRTPFADAWLLVPLDAERQAPFFSRRAGEGTMSACGWPARVQPQVRRRGGVRASRPVMRSRRFWWQGHRRTVLYIVRFYGYSKMVSFLVVAEVAVKECEKRNGRTVCVGG